MAILVGLPVRGMSDSQSESREFREVVRWLALFVLVILGMDAMVFFDGALGWWLAGAFAAVAVMLFLSGNAGVRAWLRSGELGKRA